MTVDLDGPRLSPASGGPARHLVVLLHGYGSDGNDLIALGQSWRALLPDAAFVAPNAPEPCPGNPQGYQWFELQTREFSEMWHGVNRAAPVLDAFLDRELAGLGLADGNLALVGFSQGTMMALHVGLRRRAPAAAVLGYSGTLAGPDKLEGAAVVRPPVMLVHGDADEVMPFHGMFIAAQAMAKAGLAVEWHLSPGVAHGIDPAGLEIGGAFLKRSLAARP